MTDLSKELIEFRQNLGVVESGPLEKELFEKIERLFETPPLQTLKHRKQLGLLYRVKSEWEKSAKHTRYEHSVGVVAKCIVAADIINANTKKLGNCEGMTATDLLELATAAAIHDSGHLPISHASERALITSGEESPGVTHEERIIPLLLVDNEYFNPIRKLVLDDWLLHEDSLYRIACLLSPNLGAHYTRSRSDFTWPKRAASQLLASELDMDRLDYIIRDATALKYQPVVQMIDRMVKYVNGLTFEKTKTIGRRENDDIELCLDEKYIQEAFYTLVARVLLYRNRYFHEDVRGFEGTLTYLLGELFDNDVYLDVMQMMLMSDSYFIEKYLEDRVQYITEVTLRDKLSQIIDVLKKKRVGRFKKLRSIHAHEIKNPRQMEEFAQQLNSRQFVRNLHKTLLELAKTEHDQPDEIEEKSFMLDIFNLKTGGGDFLVRPKNATEPNKTLKKFMNGSNMHRLCTEQRIDVFIHSDLYPKIETSIDNAITKFLSI